MRRATSSSGAAVGMSRRHTPSLARAIETESIRGGGGIVTRLSYPERTHRATRKKSDRDANGSCASWNQTRMLRNSTAQACLLVSLVACQVERGDEDARFILWDPPQLDECGQNGFGNKNDHCCLNREQTELSCASDGAEPLQCFAFGGYPSPAQAQETSICLPCGHPGQFGPEPCCSGSVDVVTGEFTGVPTCLGDASCHGPESGDRYADEWSCTACGGPGQEACPTCGGAGQPPCPGNACATGAAPTTACTGETTCEPTSCGADGQACCTQAGVTDCRPPEDNCPGTDQICWGLCSQFDECYEHCEHCGQQGEYCCDGIGCDSGFVCNAGSRCSCGQLGEPPCASTGCAAGLVDHAQSLCGAGQGPAVHTCEASACGDFGQPCCNSGEACWASSCSYVGGKWRSIAAQCSANVCT
jgi:hypothetical protein